VQKGKKRRKITEKLFSNFQGYLRKSKQAAGSYGKGSHKQKRGGSKEKATPEKGKRSKHQG